MSEDRNRILADIRAFASLARKHPELPVRPYVGAPVFGTDVEGDAQLDAAMEALHEADVDVISTVEDGNRVLIAQIGSLTYRIYHVRGALQPPFDREPSGHATKGVS